MVGVGPWAHISPQLGHQRLGQRIAHPVHRHESNPGNPEAMRTGVPRRGVLTLGVRCATWRWSPRAGRGRLAAGLATGRADGEGPCELGLASAAWGRGASAQGERVGEATQRLLAPRAGQSQSALVSLLLTAVMAAGGAWLGGAVASDHGTHEARPREPRDVAARWGSRDGHRQERVVQVQDRRKTMCKAWDAMAEAGPSGDQVGFRATRSREPPVPLQGLAPLTGEDVTLAPWHALERGGTDQATGEPTGCSLLKEGQPRDASRVHRHRLHAAVDKPAGQRLESSGIGATGAHDLLGLPIGHTGHARMGTHSAPCGLGGARAHAGAWTGCALRSWGTRTLTELTHESPPGAGAMQGRAITLDHLWSRACASGSQPPVSDAGVIENPRAGRDPSHQSFVGSARVMAPRYCRL
jgi:hypothetical protein